MAFERLRHRHPLRRGVRVDALAAERELRGAGRARRFGQQLRAIVHQRLIGFVRPVPFQHGEFGMMQRAPLAVTERAGEFEDARFARRQELLAGELRRGPQVKRLPLAAGPDQLGGEGMQMGLVAGGNLERGGFHFDEIVAGKPGPHGGGDRPTRPQEGLTAGMDSGKPKRRAFSHIYLKGTGQKPDMRKTGIPRQDRYGAARNRGFVPPTAQGLLS